MNLGNTPNPDPSYHANRDTSDPHYQPQHFLTDLLRTLPPLKGSKYLYKKNTRRGFRRYGRSSVISRGE